MAVPQQNLPSSPLLAQPMFLVDTNGNIIASFGGGTQYTDGGSAPTHPVGTELVYNNGGIWVAVSAANGLPITGSISATNPSVGTNGSAIPTSSTLIGASDGTNEQQLLVESASHPNLRVGIYAGATEAGVTANGLKVDGSAVTQPVSAASLPLPSGAATAAKQPALGTAGSASSDVLSVQGIASMTPLKVDGSGVTQPVSVATLPSGVGANTVANSLPITNAAVQGWISATGTGTASQDDALTFPNQVRKVVLYNASSAAVPLEFDQTSSATSFPIQPGQYMVFDDVLCTTVHVYPSALLPINTTAGLYVKGWK